MNVLMQDIRDYAKNTRRNPHKKKECRPLKILKFASWTPELGHRGNLSGTNDRLVPEQQWATFPSGTKRRFRARTPVGNRSFGH
ncbi:hypothetical protein [Bacillus sp. FJAT-27245]|uniref:hypothetical protein n=1 Tax=Bacillus sp. FJAT-27245 TaxID=1684144 RepID=UPI0012E26A79|nr:hypothetical protein [Bacillus sp. FJAT-27245]